MKFYLSIIITLTSSFTFAQDESTLDVFNKEQLLEDYDLVVSSLKEAHPGLYWYTSFAAYEAIFKQNRDKIHDGMSSYEFYRVLSFIVSADKEGHSSVSSSKDIGNYTRSGAKHYLPFGIKTINKELYLINDLGTYETKGKVIKSLDGVSIDTILQTIFNHTSRLSDGFTTTGKYKNLDRFGFSGSYLDFIHDFKKTDVSLGLIDPKTNTETELSISMVDRDSLISISKENPRKKNERNNGLYSFEIRSNTKTALLNFNSFSYGSYEREGLNFEHAVDSLFDIITKEKVKNLIIDIRNNSGGSEGAEDYLYSYLTREPYKKYNYVVSSALTYSFIDFTNYKDREEDLYGWLWDEHYLTNDGLFLRKTEVLPTELPQKKPFKGNVYILISGKTYSGGSEFASIAKSQNRATFIGEETGGGFYGQTSGSYIFLLLPNTQMEIRIPLLKFSTTFKSDDIPLGRGVIPGHQVGPTFEEYSDGIDAELEYVLALIKNGK
ncbi:MAG: S41 family peptidase [Ekhidna sp.]